MRMRILVGIFMFSVLVFAAAPVRALTAEIYGYTKAEYVTGSLRVPAASGDLELTGFTSIYPHPLEVYVSRGYDLADGTLAGVLPVGFEGRAVFDVPAGGISDEDMVFFMVPGWSVPVAVGLFRPEGMVYMKPPGER